MFDTLAEGQTLTLDYYWQTSKKTGKSFAKVVEIVDENRQASPRFVPDPQPQTEPAPWGGQAAQPTSPQLAPLAQPAEIPWEKPTPVDSKDCAMFVTGVVGRAMGSGRFSVTDINKLTECAHAAYVRLQGLMNEPR